MKQMGYTAVELLLGLFFFILIPGAIIGWIWNIVKLCSMTFDPLTGLLAVRIVGIFVPPVGAIVGYF